MKSIKKSSEIKILPSICAFLLLIIIIFALIYRTKNRFVKTSEPFVNSSQDNNDLNNKKSNTSNTNSVITKNAETNATNSPISKNETINRRLMLFILSSL